MFRKILIANRGEIACRIIGTCRRLGVATVAIFSEADRQARHVRLADEAYCVGEAASRDSYLRADRIVDVARAAGADAIHPGYGFLSESEAFAQACEAAGIVFIGPPVSAIRAMGSKSAAKALMETAGVPLVPGYHGDDQAPALLREQADRIGYPVLLKAVAGGGGKGMRVVEDGRDFDAALSACQREAAASFGNDQVLIERYLQRPRHIEIQVFGDRFGQVIHLNERDCSAQRRHQKVVEEAPAPSMTDALRAAMGKAACDAARAVGYVGAGTVEFIADQQGAFYFMEMNTRLQVEHPVTEMITGLDLVEWQLRVAAGEPLPLAQDQIGLDGHAIEVRVYAEDPVKGFLPSTGSLIHYAPPAASAHVRVDTGVDEGDVISPYYDPMIAKLIVWDRTREAAISRLLGALGDFRIVGVGNNLAFLSRLVDHPEFRAGTVDTGLIAREAETLLAAPDAPPDAAFELAALWLAACGEGSRRRTAAPLADPSSPWANGDGWRLNGGLTRELRFLAGDEEPHRIDVAHAGDGLRINGQPAWVRIGAGGAISYGIGARQGHAVVVATGNRLHLFDTGRHHVVDWIDPLASVAGDAESAGGLVAPMPGRIIALLVEPGSVVEKGAPLLVMEAMKMEYTISAPAPGTVDGYRYQVGDQVQDGAALVDFTAAA